MNHFASRLSKNRFRTTQVVRRNRLGRALIPIIVGVAGLSVLGFAGFFTWVSLSAPPTPEYQLDVAIKLLDDGKWELPMRIARSLKKTGKIDTPALETKLNYVIGVAGSMETETHLDIPEGRSRLAVAANYLRKAKQGGFPIGHQGVGKYQYAWALFHTYQWPEAITSLKAAAADYPQKRFDVEEMLIQCYLRKNPPDPKRALEYADQWLQQDGLTKAVRDRGKIQKAEALFALGSFNDARSVVQEVEPDSPRYSQAQLLLGRLALERGKHDLEVRAVSEGENADLEEAVKIFRSLVTSADTPVDVRRQAAYLTGVSLRKTGRKAEALGTFSGIRQRSPRTAEAIAAGLEEAEIQVEADRINDAIDTVQLIVLDCAKLKMFDQRWLTVDELRGRLLRIASNVREKNDFSSAIRLSGLLPPFLPKTDSIRLEAESYRDWANAIKSGRFQAPESAPGSADRDPKELMLKASEKYIELAGYELATPRYPDTLWTAIECLQVCELYPKSNELLEKYLDAESRARRPRGLYQLASNYYDMGDLDRAQAPLETLVRDFPDHPLSYQARLMAARIFNEKGNLTEGIELLTQNLYDGSLTPESEVWRDSLLELGTMFYREGDLSELNLRTQTPDERQLTSEQFDAMQQSFEKMIEAANRLRESVGRYPNDSRSLVSQFLAGKAYQQASMWPKTQLAAGKILLDTQRKQLQAKRRELLESSLIEYRRLKDRLNELRERESLTAAQIDLLRGCYFGEADSLFELGRYDEAIAAYRSTGSRFLDRPESLEALLQVARCQLAVNRKEDAKRTLMQAEQVLSRIPVESDPDFTRLTRYDRKGWQSMIAWMKTW